MKNSGIKMLTAVVIGMVVLMFLNRGQNPTSSAITTPDPNNLHQAMVSQFNDNVRDVSARLLETENKLTKLVEENQQLRQNNTALLDKSTQPTMRSADSSLTFTVEQLQREIQSLKASAAPKTHDRAEYPIGNVESFVVGKPIETIVDLDERLLKRPLSPQETHYWERLQKKAQLASTSIEKKPPEKDIHEPKGTPYYTIPAGADLGHTTLMSALIGEVPSEGKLMQPLFPFSALIGRGDLMASNGVPLPPDIAGMKVNGYAIGVGSFLDNISCVRAYVTSILFTFQDGHFVVVGQETQKNSAELVNNDSLGYLTTPYGNPCIQGAYFTNAPQVLTAMMAAGGVQGVGNALAQWQLSYFAGPYGASAFPTGSFGAYAGGGAASQGAVKAADWLEKRLQGSFDMVFVPASQRCPRKGVKAYCPTQVSLHLTQTISIDKAPKGRVIDYGRLQNYTRDFSLR